MENFIVQINGSYIDLPYVANAADGKSQPRRSYLTSGTEVASGCGYSYCYKTLKLVLKGKEHFLPENLYREGVSYRFLDYHTEWPFLLRERGGKIVKKQIPLLALYGIAPEEVLDRSAFCKLTLPEFQHKGKLTTVFYVGAYRFGVAFESDLMQLYHRKAEFAEDKAALFMADEYRFWIDGGSNPTAYFADGLRCEKRHRSLTLPIARIRFRSAKKHLNVSGTSLTCTESPKSTGTRNWENPRQSGRCRPAPGLLR